MEKWQHGFVCSQYYLGYFKCILQDYSKKYDNISFPYINRWTKCLSLLNAPSTGSTVVRSTAIDVLVYASTLSNELPIYTSCNQFYNVQISAKKVFVQ